MGTYEIFVPEKLGGTHGDIERGNLWELMGTCWAKNLEPKRMLRQKTLNQNVCCV